MQLQEIKIRNFRSVRETDFVLANKIAVLLGGNESGKSNILRALNFFYNHSHKLSADDKYQLADGDPEITLTFELNAPNSEFGNIFEQDIIDKIILQRKGDSYYIIEPSIKSHEEVVNASDPASEGLSHSPIQEAETTNESTSEVVPAEAIAAETPPTEVPSTEVPVTVPEPIKYLNEDGSLTQNCIDILFTKIPIFVYLQSLNEDFISGKNIPIPELIKHHTDESGKFRTIWDFLAIGGITSPAQLNNTDVDQRLKYFHRISSRISKKINAAWKQEDVKIRITAADNNLVIHIRDGKNCDEKDDTTWIWACPEDRSYGFQWYLTFYSRFIGGTNGTMKNAMLLLDDPGLALNAVAQRDLNDLFQNLSEDNQIIFTTHSPYMVDWEKTENVFLAEKQRKNGCEGTVINSRWKFKKLRELPEPLRDIGFTCAGQILNRKNLIVEGPSDKIVINKVNNIFKFENKLPRIMLDDFRVVDAGTASETVPLANYTSKTEDLDTLIMLDHDDEGQKVKQRCEAANLKYFYVTDVLSSKSTKKETIEDLLPFENYLEAVNQTHKDVYDDWMELKKEDFEGSFTPMAQRFKDLIKKKVPSAADSKNPLKKEFAMQYVCDNFTINNFLRQDGELNEHGKYFASLFEKVSTMLK